jgi:hypothetical protein
MIKWRNISKVGNPKDCHKNYLVTDGRDISTTEIHGTTHYKGDGNPTFKFSSWSGDENTYEDNSCCSGKRMFHMVPTHWCPTDEIDLP